MTALLGMIACLTIPATNAIAADDGLKTYKLTGAGWAETDDPGITWAPQLSSTAILTHKDGGVADNAFDSGAENYGNWMIQTINIASNEADDATSNSFSLTPNGRIVFINGHRSWGSKRGTSQNNSEVPVPNYETISRETDFVTQIGSRSVTQNNTSGYTTTYTLYAKARPRTAAELGQTITQMPQSGDPAASIWQSAPYLIALAAIGGAVVVSRRAKTSAV